MLYKKVTANYFQQLHTAAAVSACGMIEQMVENPG